MWKACSRPGLSARCTWQLRCRELCWHGPQASGGCLSHMPCLPPPYNTHNTLSKPASENAQTSVGATPVWQRADDRLIELRKEANNTALLLATWCQQHTLNASSAQMQCCSFTFTNLTQFSLSSAHTATAQRQRLQQWLDKCSLVGLGSLVCSHGCCCCNALLGLLHIALVFCRRGHPLPCTTLPSVRRASAK